MVTTVSQKIHPCLIIYNISSKHLSSLLRPYHLKALFSYGLEGCEIIERGLTTNTEKAFYSAYKNDVILAYYWSIKM